MTLNAGRFVMWSLSAVAGVITAWLFGLPELSILAIALWSTAAITAGLHRWRRAVPTLEAWTTPSTVTRGDPVSVSLNLVNRSERSTVPVRLRGKFATAGSGTIAVAPLEPGGSTMVAVDLPTPTRGLVRIGPLRVTYDDPLSIWRTTSDAPTDASVLIRPRAHPLAGLLRGPGPRPGPGARTAAVPGGAEADEDLVGLRPYVRGDDLRRIHWRTSARRNEPHVVQVEPPVLHTPVVILLDTRPRATSEAFERAVEAAASIAVAASDMRRPMRLLTTTPEATTSATNDRNTTLGELLDVLATVGRRDGRDPAHIIRSRPTGEASMMLCTADPSCCEDPNLDRVADIVVCTADGHSRDGLDRRGGPTNAPNGPVRVDWDGHQSLFDAWELATRRFQALPVS